MFWSLPLTPDEIEEHKVADDFRTYCECILPLEMQVLDADIKKHIKARWYNNSKNTDTFLWLTVSPPPCTTEQFLSYVAIFLKRKWVATFAYIYTIEQRKTPAYYLAEPLNHNDNGKHIHIALKNDYKKSYVLRELASNFKCSKNHVDYKRLPIAYFDDKVKYMTGLKTGPGKEEKQKGDVIFRKIYNLANIYTNATLSKKDETETSTQTTPKISTDINVKPIGIS